MKRYGIIGGTFDPIHYAHLYIAYEAKEKLNLDKVIFMPAGKQPLKIKNNVTDSKVRYDMVNIAIESFEGFSISNYEIEKSGISFTFETLEHIKQVNCKDSLLKQSNNKFNNEERKLFFITGADCLLNIEKWKEVSRIFSLCTLIVFTRGGFNKEDLIIQKEKIEEKYNTNIVILELKELEISSTDIRKRVAENQRIDFFVPPKVADFIKKNGLYKK